VLLLGLVPLLPSATSSQEPTESRQDARDRLLIDSIESGDAESVRRLLRSGVSADLLGTGGFTPLMLAVRRGDIEIIEALLASGTPPFRGAAGVTPLMLASE